MTVLRPQIIKVYNNPIQSLESGGQTPITSGKFYYIATVTIPATTMVQADLYTVPTGRRLEIGVVTVSCDASQVQQFRLRDPFIPYAFLDFYFDLNKTVNIPYEMIFPIEAGRTLQVQIYNTAGAQRDFVFSINGIEARFA